MDAHAASPFALDPERCALCHRTPVAGLLVQVFADAGQRARLGLICAAPACRQINAKRPGLPTVWAEFVEAAVAALPPAGDARAPYFVSRGLSKKFYHPRRGVWAAEVG